MENKQEGETLSQPEQQTQGVSSDNGMGDASDLKGLALLISALKALKAHFNDKRT